MVTPRRGTNGTTSTAPMRGCAPVCVRMSIAAMAARADARSASCERPGLADEAHDEPVVVRIRAAIEQAHAGAERERRDDRLDHLGPASLAVVGDALVELAGHALLDPRAAWGIGQAALLGRASMASG